MRQSIFITQDDLISPHWRTAFVDCQIKYQEPKQLAADSLVWVLAGMPNWLDIVKRKSQQRIPVIVMATTLDIQQLCSALELGARGYVEAFAAPVIIEQVAQTVSSGAIWLPGQLLSNLVGVLSKQPMHYQHNCDLTLLTERERQVVDIVVTGASNKQTAQKLNITERTVKEHMSSIFNKLKVKDRMQLMLTVKG